MMFLLAACGPTEEETTDEETATDEEAEEMYRETVKQEGRDIAQEAFKAISGVLQEKIEEGGIEKGIDYCSVEAIPLTDSVAEAQNAHIKRISDKPRNPDNEATSEEVELMNEYRQKMKAGEDLKPTLKQRKGEDVFYAPIAIQEQLCLNCHGQEEAEIDSEHLSLIRELYPEGQATGYEMGDLRGMWQIAFERE